MVTNGRGVNSITKTSTSGLVDTYRISYNDGTSGTFTVPNGAKGDKGDTAYIWIKYASQEPTASSHSFGDVPDDWMGVYFGFSDTAPIDWQQYKWYKVKGEKGDTGTAATLISSEVTYQTSTSGTIIPSGQWQSNIPVVSQGNYLWTRTVYTFNTGSPVTTYSVSRFGMDGTGAVSSVAGISPDTSGNVQLTAENVGAVNRKGDTMEGSLNMNGQALTGLNAPENSTDAVNKAYADSIKQTADNASTAASGKESKKLSFYNVAIPVSSFVADTTYADFPYRAAVALSGVMESMIPEVVLSLADAVSGNFAPVAACYNGGVYIYAAEVPEADMTVPTILCWRGE